MIQIFSKITFVNFFSYIFTRWANNSYINIDFLRSINSSIPNLDPWVIQKFLIASLFPWWNTPICSGWIVDSKFKLYKNKGIVYVFPDSNTVSSETALGLTPLSNLYFLPRTWFFNIFAAWCLLIKYIAAELSWDGYIMSRKVGWWEWVHVRPQLGGNPLPRLPPRRPRGRRGVAGACRGSL